MTEQQNEAASQQLGPGVRESNSENSKPNVIGNEEDFEDDYEEEKQDQ